MAGALLGALAVVLLLAGAARAADGVYWSDFEGGQIFRADLAGGAPTPLLPPSEGARNIGGVAVDAAAGKLYWTQLGNGGAAIMVADLDGGGARPLNTSGSKIDGLIGFPIGLTIDSRGGRVYWANVEIGGGSSSIGYANLDGSGGGVVDTTGASVDSPEGLAVYPAAGRIYWTDTGADKIAFANLAGGGGGNLEIEPGAVSFPSGLAIDAASQKIYWGNVVGADTIGVANLAGGAATELRPSGIDDPTGVALDTAANRLYWGQAAPPALMFASPLDGSGVGGGFDLSDLGPGAAVLRPILFKAPVSAGAATLSGRAAIGGTLTCASSAWLPDAPEAQLYRAARAVSYQWLRGGQPVAGATASAIKVTEAGSYTCHSIGTNGAGSTASAPSPAVFVRATLKLGKARLNRGTGTATIAATVGGSGRLIATGKGVAKATKLAKTSRTYRLEVRTTGKAKRRLLARGRARVRVTVTFAPSGDKSLRRSKTVVLERR
jgi:hypothetical protein